MPNHALDAHKSPQLLDRILDTPNLPQVVRQLDPQLLHRLVRVIGLEDCGAIVSLATPEQLTRVFDIDLWGAARPGVADRFDVDRFGLWLEVLVEAGASIAAEKLVGLDFDFVAAAVAEHIMVVDQTSEIASAVVRSFVQDTQNEDAFERATLMDGIRESGLGVEINGYAIAATRTESWDALLAVLGALDSEHPDYLQRLLSTCCSVSARHIDESGGLHELLSMREQLTSDVASDREQRREKQGYATASQAVAFLQAARELDLRAEAAPSHDWATRGYFRDIERPSSRSNARESSSSAVPPSPPGANDPGVAMFLETLRDAGVLTNTPRGLLVGERAEERSGLGLITARMQFVGEHDEDVYMRRTEELGYLANVLVAGCSFNSGHLSIADAQDAVTATCNLGLENWPRSWRPSTIGDGTLPHDFLLHHDLVTAFQVGWTVLYQQVVVFVARRLMTALTALLEGDTVVQDDLRTLCRRLHQYLNAGTPWRVRDHLDVIAILDTTSWAILLRLLDQCPSVPHGERRERPALRVETEFVFVSENRQIEWVRTFADELSSRLVA